MSESALPALPVMAPPAACLDCGAPIAGPFCSSCGQKAVAPNPTFRDLVGDAWSAFVDLDGRVLLSLRTLLLQPGRLTLEYLAGRRTRYLTPLRLYITCSVAFVLVQSALPRAVDVGAGIQGDSGAVTRVLGGSAGQPAWQRQFIRGWQRVHADPTPFAAELKHQLPRVVFVLVPLLAMLLAAAFRNRRRNLPAHLVFALHAHSFLAVALLLSYLGNASESNLVDGALDAAAILWSVYWLPVAMRRAYGGGWIPTLGRALAVGSLYVVLSGIVLVPFVMTLIWWHGRGA